MGILFLQGEEDVKTASSATLLQVQYPPVTPADVAGASYPRLAEELRRIGSPMEDWKELFGRMVFNAMVGNDDDHCRNHAVYYRERDGAWRLSPAFDVVPSTADTPKTLQLQLSRGSREISRESILADYRRFGFHDIEDAQRFMGTLVERITGTFEIIRDLLPPDMVEVMALRVQSNKALLLGEVDPENKLVRRPKL